MQEYLTQNRAILQQDDPNLLRELEAISTEGVTVEAARKGGLTLRLDDLYVHSKYDPAKEVLGLVTGEPQVAHIHFGLGLGHLLSADPPRQDGTVLIFEPHKGLAAAALRYTPLGELLRSRRARLVCSMSRFKEQLGWVLKGDQPHCIRALPFHARTFASLWEEVQKATKSVQYNSAIALRTLERNAAYLTHGALVGLAHTTRLPGVENLENSFLGKPALIISAGPSLDVNLADLVSYADRCLIIAIARSARPLMGLGIRPHFLVHNEPKPFYQFIDGCDNLDKTAFVLSLQGERQYYAHAHGPTFVFQNVVNFAGRWISELYPAIAKAPLHSGGSVSTEALSLAVLAGCNPIVMIGQDLAVKPNRYYAQAETNQRFSHQPGDVVTVPGYFGKTVTSLNTYYSYAQWFEDTALNLARIRPELRLINATEGGVRMGGFLQMKLRDAARRFFREPISTGSVIEAAARVAPEKQLLPGELLLLVSRSEKKLEGLDALIDDFETFAPPLLQELQEHFCKGSTFLQKKFRRMQRYKDRFLQLNEDLYVLSGFMQAELIGAKRQQRQRVNKTGSTELERLVCELANDVEDFAMTLRSTRAGVTRMRLALDELKEALISGS